MVRSFRVLITFCVIVLLLVVAGALVFFILGTFILAAVCAVGAVILFALTLVLGRNLRIKRIIEQNEFPDEE